MSTWNRIQCNGLLDSSSIRTSHEEIYSREIIARLSLIIRKAENGDIEVVYSFLNGIRRRMSVDFEATTSVIYNTDSPWKSRRFTIESVENDLDKNGGILKPDKEKDHENFSNLNMQIRMSNMITTTTPIFMKQRMK